MSQEKPAGDCTTKPEPLMYRSGSPLHEVSLALLLPPSTSHCRLTRRSLSNMAALCSRRMFSSTCCFLILATAALVHSSDYFINDLAEYGSLASCAQEPLSTIVRVQASGCGMSSSYSCFCTDQSSSISSVIFEAVSEECVAHTVFNDLDQASSAVNVFDVYCKFSENAQASLTSASSEQSARFWARSVLPVTLQLISSRARRRHRWGKLQLSLVRLLYR